MKDVYVGMLISSDALMHYGVAHDKNPPGRGSGRWGWGTGKNSEASKSKASGSIKDLRKYNRELTDSQAQSNKRRRTPADYVITGINKFRSYIADKAVTEFDERVSSQPIDKATGLHLKTKEWSVKEDVSAVNPAFTGYDKESDNKGLTQNCEFCTLTYDMRRRGFDVRAKSSYEGHFGDELAARCYVNSKTHNLFPAKGDFDRKGNVKQQYWDFIDHRLKSQGNGARGNFEFVWLGTYAGHSVVYEVENDKVVFRDCQANDAAIDSSSFYSLMDPTFVISYTRLDNIDYNPKRIKEVCK